MRALLCLALACCTPAQQGPFVSEAVIDFRIGTPQTNKGDILIVLDDSPAMATVRGNLQSNLGPLVASLGFESRVDFHLALINGSSTGLLPQTSCTLDPFIDTRVDYPDSTWVANVTTALACMAGPGTSTSVQQPLAAAFAALDTPGFVREDAYLSIIIITNGDDLASPDAVVSGIEARKANKQAFFTLFADTNCPGGTPATRLARLLATAPYGDDVHLFCASWSIPSGGGDYAGNCLPPLADPANPDCSVVDVHLDWRHVDPMPMCTTYGPRPCWQVASTTWCPSRSLVIDRGGVDPPDDVYYSQVECVIAF
jgi:hypothetical protein